MANTKSAKKMVRKIATNTAVNAPRRSKIRTMYKKVETAIKAGDAKAAQTALCAADKEAQRGVTKGIVKKNTVARKVSRLSASIKALGDKKAA